MWRCCIRRTGALNLAQIGLTLAQAPVDGLVIVAFMSVTAGFCIKAAVVPFHFAHADAHAVEPVPVLTQFSGIMLPLRLYGVAHTYWTVFAGALRGEQAELTRIQAAAGTTTALVAGVMCFAQNHLKRLLAFSSISHIGPFLIGIALFTPRALTGTFIYILAHGTLSAASFLGMGILLHRYTSVDEIELQGRVRPLYITGTLFFCAGISLAGLPPFGTHIANTLIEEFAKPHGDPWIVIVSIIATMFTTGAVLRATDRVFIGWGTKRRNQR